MLRDKRGHIRVFEALLAAAVVFSALLVKVPINVSLENGRDSGVLHSIGLNALIELDKDGELGWLIARGNWTELSKRLAILVPLAVSYNVTVYDEDMRIVNDSLVSGGGMLAKNIVSIQYLLAERTSRQFYVIRLQLAWTK